MIIPSACSSRRRRRRRHRCCCRCCLRQCETRIKHERRRNRKKVQPLASDALSLSLSLPLSICLAWEVSFSLSLSLFLSPAHRQDEGLLPHAFVASRHESCRLTTGARFLLRDIGAIRCDASRRRRRRRIQPLSHAYMDGPGTITWEEFLEDAERFLFVSDRISDGWELRGDKGIPGQAYLFRRTKCFVSNDSAMRDDKSTDDDEEFHVKFQEDPHEACSTIETPFITEHHILWSISYGVPILYFNKWRSDFPGINPMSVNEAQTIHDSKLNYMELSQAIHPIVGTPFLQLHPCLSQELLRSMSKSKNKLVSWLSCVAPAAINLKIHPEYYKLTY